MVKKITKYLKFVVCCALILSLIAPSYAALSASDGSAFVTKAEFDSALADFNARLTTFEAGINSKIDSQVTSYLDRNGIWNGNAQTLAVSYLDLSEKSIVESTTLSDFNFQNREENPTIIVNQISKSGLAVVSWHYKSTASSAENSRFGYTIWCKNYEGTTQSAIWRAEFGEMLWFNWQKQTSGSDTWNDCFATKICESKLDFLRILPYPDAERAWSTIGGNWNNYHISEQWAEQCLGSALPLNTVVNVNMFFVSKNDKLRGVGLESMKVREIAVGKPSKNWGSSKVRIYIDQVQVF